MMSMRYRSQATALLLLLHMMLMATSGEDLTSSGERGRHAATRFDAFRRGSIAMKFMQFIQQQRRTAILIREGAACTAAA